MSTFVATAQADNFAAFHFSSEWAFFPISAFGPSAYNEIGGGPFPDANEPYNGIIENTDIVSGDPNIDLAHGLIGTLSDQIQSTISDALAAFGVTNHPKFIFELFDDSAVNYAQSNAAISIDLQRPVQHGGYAEGDVLTDAFEISGSIFDDVIRGSNPSDYPPDTVPIIINGTAQGPFTFTLHNNPNALENPGNNILNGGDGNDVLEGRGGVDLLDGGIGLDFASYESSPAAVIVRLAGVGNDTQTFVANGGDATGDTFVSIEGLIGSEFNDSLTGNTLNNVLAGGLGNDTLNGKDGIDTADYSRDYFFDLGNTADKVVVHLGLNGALGTAAEFEATNLRDSVAYIQVSTDRLNSIENVTGTAGSDQIFGNEQANVLTGRDGDDTMDGGLGSDTLLGGLGNDTVTYASHSGLSGEFGTITLDGSAQYFVNGPSGFVPILVETDTLVGIENVVGSNLNETLNGNSQDNVLDGGLGNDIINGAGGSDTVSYVSHDGLANIFGEQDSISLGINGADGSYTRRALVGSGVGLHFQTVESDVLRNIESVTGSSHSETINGNDQGNTLAGRGGDDTINGGGDNDIYDFRGTGLGSDRYFDTSGSDILLINNFSDIAGTPHRVGANDSDLEIDFRSGIGTVTIVNHFAGNPIETLMSSNGATMVLATGQVGGSAPGLITGTEGKDLMDGKGGDDFLFGNGGADHMLGGSGNDRLDGGKGNDILDGGAGNDILTGGKGHDTFVFAPSYPDGSPGDDVITDFVHGQDRIDLTAFHTSTAALFGDHHHDAGGPAPAPILIQSMSGNMVLGFDGGSITIEGVHQLHANDFIV